MIMEPKKRNIALVYGLIAGVSLVALMTILYLGGVALYLSGWAYLGYVILIGLAAAAALAQKKANGGYLEFAAALKTSFTVFVIALAAQTLFSWLLLNVIDTHFRDVLNQAVLGKIEHSLRQLGLGEDRIDDTMARERSANQFSSGRVVLGLAMACIVHFIIALLIAAIVKKNKPLFQEVEL